MQEETKESLRHATEKVRAGARTVFPKGFDLGDYLALYQMSLRRFFWQVDGRGAMRAAKQNFWVYLICLILAYLPIYQAAMLVVSVVAIPVFLVATLLPNMAELRAITGMLPVSIPMNLIWLAAMLLLVTNPRRLLYNLRYSQSAWYRNTGLRPKEVKADRGLYGEYAATYALEANLQKNHIYGKVFNNVILTKNDKDTTELDAVMVCECGLFAVEAKAKGGALYGKLWEKTWIQWMGQNQYEMENPFWQNQNHINYLQEYLYKTMPEGSARLKATLPAGIVNMALFAEVDIEDHLDRSVMPRPSYIGMVDGKSGLVDADLRMLGMERLTPQEVDAIAAALEPVSHYTREERYAFTQQHLLRNERGDFNYPALYYVGGVDYDLANGDTAHLLAICREQGGYFTYQDPDDSFFKALPGRRITEKLCETRNYDKAVETMGYVIKGEQMARERGQ